MRLVIITGISGSGKSTAARTLEDEGFFVVDNLPLVLLPRFLSLGEQAESANPRVAIVMDARNRDFLTGGVEILQQVIDSGRSAEILFFDASDEELIRRFSETRRRHPLVEKLGVVEAINRERRLISPLRPLATKIFDSTGLTVHQLRRKVIQHVQGKEAGAAAMVVHLQSFGYRYGVPLESDLVMDVRFLPNPHFVPGLRPLTGLNVEVRSYVLRQEACIEFLRRFRELLLFLVPQYQKEGKSTLTISIGCTGGRHRSVSVVEALGPSFSFEGVTLGTAHRDISKEAL